MRINQSCMVRGSIIFGIFFLFSVFSVGAIAEQSYLQIRCQDSFTGHPVSARIDITDREGATKRQFVIDSACLGELELPSSRYDFDLSAAGYRGVKTSFELEAGRNLPVTIWFDAIETPSELNPDEIEGIIGNGYGILHGYIHDVVDGLPIPFITARLEERGLEVQSDEQGYFRLVVPVEDFDETALPPMDSLIIEGAGYKNLRISPVFIHGSDTLFIEDLTPGKGLDERDNNHKMLVSKTDLADEISMPVTLAPIDYSLPMTADGYMENESFTGLVVIDPPANIRVGLSCSCTSCSSVSVMSLETYVRRGLNDEWISSWDYESLKSGANAYRSYGSWYVSHPISSNYDICSTTCCQVNDSDSSTRTNTAANRTAGFMLQRNSSLFRSEYSAENNSWNDPNDGLSCVNGDLSCGDGYVGSPANSWPCLYDSVATGHGCFGHGRGMSQWGTQRWASTYNKYWNWITNHYYNASGNPSGYRSAYITSPVTMTTSSFWPTSVSPGETFTIYVNGQNYGEQSLYDIMIGSSLYSSAHGYIDDSAHDAKVTFSAGSNSKSRLFTVPTGTKDGSYDVLVSLYLDVTEDNAISASDMAITLMTLPTKLTVSSSSTVNTK